LRPPTAEELAALVEQEIDEEILYRQAVAMGLDRDDLVIRRRLATKMEFLTDDLAETANASDAELQDFLLKHPTKFTTEALTTFAQVYIDRSRHGDEAASEAERVLALLNAKENTDWKALGDSLPVPSAYLQASDADVARVFGREFPKSLSQVPVGRWSGPVASGYGLHLVLVRARVARKTPPLDEVRDSVLSEWRTERRQELSDKVRAQRRSNFHVTIQWPDWAREAATKTAASITPKGAS
jgi:hypothetical protein